MSFPLVAIVGRANVGKSTLFNKIIGKRLAIVNDEPGVTRDRNYGMTEWFGKSFMMVDTGGIDIYGKDELESRVKDQAYLAMNEADCIMFVVDGLQGRTPQDKEVVDFIRRSGKPLFLVVNKVDHATHEPSVFDFADMGVDKIFPLSAEHGNGVMELMEELVLCFPERPAEEESESIKIAVVGRPNVGKSSLVNGLLHSDRCIVSEIPGTTRDSIDSRIMFADSPYVLIDTAGIRRKGKTTDVLDKFSVIMSLKAIERCDIVVLVVDAVAGVTDQDATIAGYAYEKGRGCIVAVNKWDLVEPGRETYETIREKIHEKLKFLEFAPVFAVSAKTGYNLERFFPQIQAVYREYSKKVPTAKVNECFERAIKKNPMSSFRGKFMKLFYGTQVKSCPPTFRCFVNFPQGIHFSYRRYLTNSLRKTFGFSGTPVRLVFSQRNSRN